MQSFFKTRHEVFLLLLLGHQESHTLRPLKFYRMSLFNIGIDSKPTTAALSSSESTFENFKMYFHLHKDIMVS